MIQFILISILVFAPVARGSVRPLAFGPIYILTFVILLMALFRQKRIEFKRTPLDIPIFLFLGFSIVSFLNSAYMYASIMELMRIINLVLIFYIVINFFKSEESIKRILGIILVIGTSVSLFGILQYIGIIDKSWWDNARFLSATYVNHNHFAGLVEFIMPLSIGMMLSEKTTSKKIICIYSFLVMSMAFLLSMSRGGWFSLSLAMLFMSFTILKRGKIRYLSLISVLFFIILGLFVFGVVDTEFLLRRVSSYREFDLSGRLEIWKGTVAMIKNNLFFGTGTGTFIHNFPKYRPIGLNMLVNYAHNDYLQIASDMGIFAAALVFFIIGKTIRKALITHTMAHTSFKKWISLSLATGILSIAIHSLGDFNLFVPSNAILFAVFSGLIFNVSSKKEKECPIVIIKPIPSRFLKSITAVVISLAVIFTSACIFAETSSMFSDKHISLGELDTAERYALNAIAICPFNHSYQFKLAHIYIEKGVPEKSVKRFNNALHLNPLDGWSWIGLADVYALLSRTSFQDNDFIGLADAAYRRALDLDPLNSYYLKKFARFLLNYGDTRLSSRLYKKASSIMAKSRTLSRASTNFVNADLYEEMADLTFSAQDIDKALTFYKMANEFRGERDTSRLGMVRCYMKKSLMKEALDVYKGCRPSKVTKSILFSSLGEYYLRKGRVETAERFATKSICLNPENTEGYFLMHKLSKKLNRGNTRTLSSKILQFNNSSLNVDFKGGLFEVYFAIGEDLYIERDIELNTVLPAGLYEFSIKAKGREALDVWPHMAVKFNGKNILDTYVNNSKWKEYQGIVIADYPFNRFEIAYDNDYYDARTGEDRNLYIDGIRLRILQ